MRVCWSQPPRQMRISWTQWSQQKPKCRSHLLDRVRIHHRIVRWFHWSWSMSSHCHFLLGQEALRHGPSRLAGSTYCHNSVLTDFDRYKHQSHEEHRVQMMAHVASNPVFHEGHFPHTSSAVIGGPTARVWCPGRTYVMAACRSSHGVTSTVNYYEICG